MVAGSRRDLLEAKMAEISAPSATPVVTPEGVGDPSPRVLELTYREAKQLEDKILLRFDTIQTKFQSYDNAVRLLQEFANRQPTTEAVNGDVKALKELIHSQLDGIHDEIGSLKELINAIFEGNKVALNAALMTQKEGSDKIERNFNEQFKNITMNMVTLTKTYDDKINDIKDRFNKAEGNDAGRASMWAAIASAIFVAASIAGIVGFFLANNGP